MASYSDHYKDVQRQRFIERWADNPLPECTEANLRWNVARANAAEAKVREYEAFFTNARRLLDRG